MVVEVWPAAAFGSLLELFDDAPDDCPVVSAGGVLVLGEVEVAAPLVPAVPEFAPFTSVAFAPVAGVALVPVVPVAPC